MPPVKKLSIEDKLDMVGFKKDSEVLGDIQDKLPSAAKVKIFKRLEDGNKAFIIAMDANDFDVSTAPEYIKSKYASKHGGGDYVIELYDGNGDFGSRSTITIINEGDSTSTEERQLRILNSAMDIKEGAIDTMINANEKLREAEKTKYESLMEIMGKQFEAIGKMYESKISDLQTKKESENSTVQQMIIQNQIDSMKREMEYEKSKLLAEASRGSGDSGTDKMMSLLTTLLPALIQKREDPTDTVMKTMGMISELTARDGDTLDSIMSNPVKINMFKEMLGVEKKKDLFEDMLENPAKAEAFKKIMGINSEEPKKDFFEQMMESQQKVEMFKRMMGINDAPPPPITVEPKKDFMEQLLDLSGKLSAAKPILMNMMGVQSAPIKSLVELIGNIAVNAGPHIVQAVTQVTNSMITMKMIEKGMINPDGSPKAIPTMPGQSYPAGGQGFSGNIPHAQPIPQQPKAIDVQAISNIEREFETIVMDVFAQEQAKNDTRFFVDKVVELMLYKVKENPSIINTITDSGNLEGLLNKMSEIVNRIVGFSKSESEELAVIIANELITKMRGQ